MDEPIITSILDQDLYKITMQQVIYHQYPKAVVAYEFRCRNEDVKLGFLASEVRNQINMLANLQLTIDEKEYLATRICFLKYDYLNYLSQFRLNPNLVDVRDVNGDLQISIKGLWTETILFEDFILSIVNELYFRHTTKFSDIQGSGVARLFEKISIIKDHPRMVISEFGTRRRYSKEWQDYVLKQLIRQCPQVVGTSNIFLAKKHNIKAHGTMAHEYISGHIGLVDNIRQAQKRALHVWQQEYDDNLGTALTDTFTTKAFFMDFDKTLSKGFSGVRHDSGDPIMFGWSVINHYKNLGIDPRTKTIVFSDGLDIPRAVEIFETFTGLIGVSFGIGTNLTNDLGYGFKPLNIVIKMVECNSKPVVKLSDVKSKSIGDPDMIKNVKESYKL